MEITRPYKNTEIVVVKNIASPEEIEILSTYAISYYKNLRSSVGLSWRASPPGVPIPHGYDTSEQNSKVIDDEAEIRNDLKKDFDKIVKEVEKRAQKVMIQEFPWIGSPRFTPFGELILRAPGDFMEPHYDGVPGLTPDNQPPNLGSVFYITDSVVGGETYYPKLNISYKPEAGSLIIHPGEKDYFHGVSAVKKGWRITMNLFAILDNKDSLELLRANT